MSGRLVCLLICLVLLSAAPASAYWTEAALGISVPLTQVSSTDIVGDGEGGVVIVWAQEDGVYVQHVNALGEGLWSPESNGLQVATCAPSVVAPQIAPASASGWLVAWKGDDSSVRAQLVTPDGDFGWDQNGVEVCGPQPSPAEVQIAAWDGGGAIVIWTDERQPGFSRVIGQRLDEDGACQWGDNGAYLNGYGADCRNLRVIAGGDEGAIIVYEMYDDTSWVVLVAQVDDPGNAYHEYVALSSDEDCSNTEVTEYSLNGMSCVFVAAENGNSGIVVQLVMIAVGPCWQEEDMIGTRLCPSACSGMTQSKPAVIADSPSSIVIAYELASGGGGGPHIYAQRIIPDANLQGFTREWVEGGRFVQGGTPETAPDAVRPRLARNASEGTMIVWREPDSESIVAQSLDVGGNRLWEEDTKLNSQTYSSVRKPEVIDELLGGSCVVWTGNRPGYPDMVYANRFRSGRIVANGEEECVGVTHTWDGPEKYHCWDLSFYFSRQDGQSTAAAIHFGPVRCNEACEYTAVATGTSPINAPLRNGYFCDIYPPGEYCYKIFPGGLPAAAGGFYSGVEDPLYPPERTYPANIDAEDAVIEEVTSCECNEGLVDTCWRLTDNGQIYQPGSRASRCTTGVQSTVLSPWFADDGRYGCKSLAIRINRDPIACDTTIKGHTCEWVDEVPQRIKVCDHTIPFYQDRYLGFSLKVIPDPDRQGVPELPGADGCIVVEWWQDNCVGPVMFFLVYQCPDTNYSSRNQLKIGLIKKNLDGHPEWLWKQVLHNYNTWPYQDLWHDFVVGYRFDPTGQCGWVQLWYDGSLVCNESNGPDCKWSPIQLGFPEHVEPCPLEIDSIPIDDPYVNQYLRSFSFGIYRAKATYKPDFEVHFDEVRHGLTYEEALPPQPPNKIFILRHTCDPEQGLIQVQWETDVPSATGKLYYRRAGQQTWTVKNGTAETWPPGTRYSAGFRATDGYTYQYKVSAVIQGQVHESCIRSEICGEEPDPEGAPAREEQPAGPFLTAVPNPFNPTTTLTFNCPATSHVELTVYAADGSRVRTVASGKYEKGVHKATWDGKDAAGTRVSSGIYFVRMTMGGEAVLTTKIVLLR